MINNRLMRLLGIIIVCACPSLAHAHFVAEPVNLPLPVGHYQWGAGAALIISFALLSYFVTSVSQPRLRIISQSPAVQFIRKLRLLHVLRAISIGGLLLCIAVGYEGVVNPYDNFNVLWFWIGFVLVFAYLSIVFGNVYALINPWDNIVKLLDCILPSFGHGLLRYPKWLSCWPALLLYMLFIWQELMGKNSPTILSELLLYYTIFNIIAAFIFGRKDWFRYGEFFAVFLSLLALLSPLRVREQGLPLACRTPGSGITEHPGFSLSLLLFVIFMLASTVFDGLHSTKMWHEEYKNYVAINIDPSLFRGMLAFPKWEYNTYALFIIFGFYVAMYTVTIMTGWLFGGARSNPYKLALYFAPTLIPIAVVYHFSHYFTLIFTHGYQIIGKISDPFALGWNVFGTSGDFKTGILPNAQWVWGIQVGSILLGHVLSVYFAHILALRIYANKTIAILSQLPMLLLMVLFTAFGLWILSLEMLAR